MSCFRFAPFILASVAGLWSPVDSSAAPDRTQWFREARFGMFIHWGVYSVPAGEWQGQPVKGIGEWIMSNRQIPVADYRAFAKDFTAANYDPQSWARLAHDAGMKYVVITAKHHDGFALYDSTASDWNAVKASGAGRDLLAPLAAAVRAEGLKFGCYYSQAQDWINPGGAKARGKGWDSAQDGDYDKYLQNVALPQVREIIERYNPSFIWWDTPVNMTPERAKPFVDVLATHPDILTNNRLAKSVPGDTKTPEQHIPPRGYPGELFEVCMTMNDTWGFKKNDTNWKSVRQILRNLSDISSKGGNFLLNVGPTPDGRIPAVSIERLQAVGRWMKINSEAIYATDAGPFSRRLPWGRVTQKRAADGATTLYLHVWEWPADGKLLLPTVTQLAAAGRLLAGGAPVTTAISPEGLVVSLPGAATDADVSVVRLDFARPVVVTQEPFNTPGADGRVEFSAQDADANGSWDGNIQLRDAGPNAYLTDWKNPQWSLEYKLKTPAVAKWTVSAEVAAPEPVQLLLSVDKVVTPAAVAATGPGLAWKTVELGVIELKAGETMFELKGGKEGLKGLSLRHLWLTPVPAPAAVVTAPLGRALQPDAGQRQLIERGYGMFIHFGLNTFNEVEWSDGKLPAASFNPTRLDCDQWIQTAKEAGFRHVILNTKHHDGFCLWDSKYTDYDVGSAPVKTDIVAEVAKACRKYGVKLGLYYSLWDRHEPAHGDKDPAKYVAYMKNQLTELLTNYGDICELWFDGGWGKPDEDWRIPEIYALIKKLQPNCQMSVNHTINIPGKPRKIREPEDYVRGDPIRFWPVDFRTKDPNLVRADDPKAYTGPDGALHYLPFEHTICISDRWNWFQKKNIVPARTPDELEELFYWCTANDNVLLVNLPPDQTGRIRENERAAILKTADQLGIRGGSTPLPAAPVNQAAGVPAESDSVVSPQYDASKAVDGSLERTRWAAKDSVASLTLSPAKPFVFDRVSIHEYADMKDLGDGFSKERKFRVQEFTLDAFEGGAWKTIYQGTEIGAAKIIHFDRKTTAEKLRLQITKASAPASIYLITVADMSTRSVRSAP